MVKFGHGSDWVEITPDDVELVGRGVRGIVGRIGAPLGRKKISPESATPVPEEVESPPMDVNYFRRQRNKLFKDFESIFDHVHAQQMERILGNKKTLD